MVNETGSHLFRNSLQSLFDIVSLKHRVNVLTVQEDSKGCRLSLVHVHFTL